MDNRVHFAISVLVVTILGILGAGVVKASSHRPSGRSSNTSVVEQHGQDGQVPVPEFLGYAGDVLTYHYSVTRQGQNTLESILTPSNVNSTDFGKVNFFAVNGKVDAQPLYVIGSPA